MTRRVGLSVNFWGALVDSRLPVLPQVVEAL